VKVGGCPQRPLAAAFFMDLFFLSAIFTRFFKQKKLKKLMEIALLTFSNRVLDST
jgi:hypothetical protein